MRAVNLLPKDQAQARGSLPSTPVLVGVCSAVLVTAILGAMFMMQSAKVTKEQQKLDALQARVDALPPAPAGPTAGTTQLASEHGARVAALSAALSNRVAWDRVFREFSLVLPDDVWLTSLTAQSPVSPAAGSTTPAPTTGQPNQECPTPPNVPGFNSGGFAHAETVYAGAGRSADHANSTAAVSQYDVACTKTLR